LSLPEKQHAGLPRPAVCGSAEAAPEFSDILLQQEKWGLPTFHQLHYPEECDYYTMFQFSVNARTFWDSAASPAL